MSTLQIGVFEDFKPGRTLLLWSSDAGPLERLKAAVGAAADARKPVMLTDLPWARAVGPVRLQVSVQETGGVTERLLGDALAVELRLSPDEARELGEKVEALASGSGAGHQYFDPPGAAFQVMISKGEYSPEMSADA